jgi:antirestriction protein ArdC
MATPNRRRAPRPTRAEDNLVAALIAQMEAGTTPWRRPWDPQGGGHHVNLLTGRPYRGANPILLSLGLHRRGSSLPYWCGFVEAQGLGLAPRRGSKGVAILMPQGQGRPAGESSGPGDSNSLASAQSPGIQPASGATGAGTGNTDPHKVDPHKAGTSKAGASKAGTSNTETTTPENGASGWVRYRPVTVFNAADLEGEAGAKDRLWRLIEQRRAMAFQQQRPEVERLAAAAKILGHWPVPVTHGGDQACYLPQSDRILLPHRQAFHSAAALYATWAHEALHSTGHPNRLGRNLAGSFGSDAYAREELVAELGAVLLGDRLEIGSPVQNHAAYLQHWITLLKTTPALLLRLLGEARQAANLICPEQTSQANAASEGEESG